jgi:hypothetical protein
MLTSGGNTKPKFLKGDDNDDNDDNKDNDDIYSLKFSTYAAREVGVK